MISYSSIITAGVKSIDITKVSFTQVLLCHMVSVNEKYSIYIYSL